MTARRVKSLHHNLGEKNVVFHREHRSKRGRKAKKQWRTNIPPYGNRNSKSRKRWLHDTFDAWKPKV